MPTGPLRLALVQSSPAAGDVDANARAAAAIIAAAAERGAHLVVFPELFLCGYDLPLLAATPSGWLAEDDARLGPVHRACAASGVTAALGAALRTRAGACVIGAPIIGPRGGLAISVKEHVHGSEASYFTPGLASPPVEVNGWHVALGICLDVAHPGHAERAARKGADLYVGSALYVRGEERRSDLHFGARAMDNRVFTALANYAGTTGGHVSCGRSGVWDPSGAVVERVAHAEEALLVVELDPAELRRYR